MRSKVVSQRVVVPAFSLLLVQAQCQSGTWGHGARASLDHDSHVFGAAI